MSYTFVWLKKKCYPKNHDSHDEFYFPVTKNICYPKNHHNHDELYFRVKEKICFQKIMIIMMLQKSSIFTWKMLLCQEDPWMKENVKQEYYNIKAWNPPIFERKKTC